MAHKNETFFTAIGCMDGRAQEPILKYGQKKFDARFADTITEAGLVGLLARRRMSKRLLASIDFKAIKVSLEKHHSKGIVVYGHEECAGNPVSNTIHKENVRRSAQIIQGLLPDNSALVVPVFVKRQEDKWVVEEL